ncbi:MAG TPA: cupin domain-containing protein [Rhizomicrobium sp.]|nr:cupin domain-containing protein [Rhizomicrobium sp.]
MKTVMIAGFVVLASTAAFAQSNGQMAVQKGTNTQTYNVPHGSKDQTVIITTRDLKDGESTAPHMHFGVEMTQVVTGTFECYVKGQPMMLMHAGESFIIPREAPHDCRPQPGSPPVHLAVTLVIDTGTAPRTPVTDVLIPKK